MTIVISQFCQEQGALKEFMVWKLGLTQNLKCLKWDLKCEIYFEFWYSLAQWKKIHKFMQRGACSIRFGNWYSLGVLNVWSEIWKVKSFSNSIYFGSLERIHKSIQICFCSIQNWIGSWPSKGGLQLMKVI
jgi:hypothetical protein